jgi:hypothetical protein
MMENCRASFGKLRMRGNLRGTKKNLMLETFSRVRQGEASAGSGPALGL